VTELVHRYGYVAVFTVVGLESLGIPVPGETMLISAALYAGLTHRLSIVLVVVAASAGAIIGDNIGYLIGHWGGYRLLVRFGRYVRLDQPKVKVARLLFHRYGPFVVFVGRFISILRAYAAFLAGANRMEWRLFLIFNAAGGVVWALAYGTAAYFLGHALDALSRWLAIGLGVAGAIAVVVGLILIRHYEGRLEAAAEREYPGPLEGYPGGPAL
jgi:membrane protein DedA with SNARE-associated domain